MSDANIERALGELIGISKTTQQTLETLRVEIKSLRDEARADNVRVERSLSEKIDTQNNAVKLRFEAVERRVDKLEDKADSTAIQIAKVGATAGTIGSLLTAGAVELIKHTFLK